MHTSSEGFRLGIARSICKGVLRERLTPQGKHVSVEQTQSKPHTPLKNTKWRISIVNTKHARIKKNTKYSSSEQEPSMYVVFLCYSQRKKLDNYCTHPGIMTQIK